MSILHKNSDQTPVSATGTVFKAVGLRDWYGQVQPMCIARLSDALDAKSHLFSRQLRDKRWGAVRDTEDLTSTAICILSLHRARIDPKEVGMDLQQTLEAMADCAQAHQYAGGLGLAIWANAVVDGFSFRALLTRCGMSLDDPALVISVLTTMEVAWLISGLVHELKRGEDSVAVQALRIAVDELFERIDVRSGLFTHASQYAPFADRIRRNVANFADQIYSVQAMALAHATGEFIGALMAANSCAERLVELQGDRGQWWWHYNPQKNRVAQAYPVYAVHQYGMAPMAFDTLARAGGAVYAEAIEGSHAWLDRNELNAVLHDREAGTLWRDIDAPESGIRNRALQLRSLLGGGPRRFEIAAKRLRVNYETRPYEWGWCLYAGALARNTSDRGVHIV